MSYTPVPEDAITVTPTLPLTSTDLQGILDEIANIINQNIGDISTLQADSHVPLTLGLFPGGLTLDVANQILSLTLNANEVGITDTGGFFAGSNVEDALQEIGNLIAAASDGVLTGASVVGTNIVFTRSNALPDITLPITDIAQAINAADLSIPSTSGFTAVDVQNGILELRTEIVNLQGLTHDPVTIGTVSPAALTATLSGGGQVLNVNLSGLPASEILYTPTAPLTGPSVQNALDQAAALIAGAGDGNGIFDAFNDAGTIAIGSAGLATPLVFNKNGNKVSFLGGGEVLLEHVFAGSAQSKLELVQARGILESTDGVFISRFQTATNGDTEIVADNGLIIDGSKGATGQYLRTLGSGSSPQWSNVLAGDISIIDTGGYFPIHNVENALQDIGADLVSLATSIHPPVTIGNAPSGVFMNPGQVLDVAMTSVDIGHIATAPLTGSNVKLALDEVSGILTTLQAASHPAATVGTAPAGLVINPATQVVDLALTGTDVPIVDAGGFFVTDNVEAALQQLGNTISTSSHPAASVGTAPTGLVINPATQIVDLSLIGTDIGYTPTAPLTATNVQAALDEVATALTGVGNIYTTDGGLTDDRDVFMAGSYLHILGDGVTPGETFNVANVYNTILTPWNQFRVEAGGRLDIQTTDTDQVYVRSNVINFQANTGTIQPHLRLYEAPDNGSFYINLRAPLNLPGTWNLTLPPDNGNPGDVLSTDGAGNTSWQAAAAGPNIYTASGTLTSDRSVLGANFNLSLININNLLASANTQVSFSAPTIVHNSVNQLTLNASNGTVNIEAGGAANSVTLEADGFNFVPNAAATIGAQLRLHALGGPTSNYVTVEAPTAIPTSYRITLPDVIGTVGQVLAIQGVIGVNAQLVWTDVAAGAAGIDDVLAVGQSLTATRTIDLNNNALNITDTDINFEINKFANGTVRLHSLNGVPTGVTAFEMSPTTINLVANGNNDIGFTGAAYIQVTYAPALGNQVITMKSRYLRLLNHSADELELQFYSASGQYFAFQAQDTNSVGDTVIRLPGTTTPNVGDMLRVTGYSPGSPNIGTLEWGSPGIDDTLAVAQGLNANRAIVGFGNNFDIDLSGNGAALTLVSGDALGASGSATFGVNAGATGAHIGINWTEINLNIPAANDLKINGNPGAPGQAIISQGPGTPPIWGTPSDLRVKRDLRILESPGEKLASISGYQYKYLQSRKFTYGVVAQEVERKMPELVNIQVANGYNDFKTVNYNGLVAVLVEEVKALRRELDELKKG